MGGALSGLSPSLPPFGVPFPPPTAALQQAARELEASNSLLQEFRRKSRCDFCNESIPQAAKFHCCPPKPPQVFDSIEVKPGWFSRLWRKLATL
jgi:hypothetical protein